MYGLECGPFIRVSSHAGAQGLTSLRENSHCVIPSGRDLREIRAGLQIVSSPFDKLRAGSSGVIPSGDLRFLSTPFKARLGLVS
jgi:hypothetical protein